MKNQRYPLIVRNLHWIVAILILIQFALGLTMESVGSSVRLAHIGLGIVIFTLVCVRITLRLQKNKEWPEAIGGSFAHIGHWVLYVFLYGVPLFGILTILPFGETFAEIHEFLAFFLLALIVGHVGMVAWHHIKGINLLSRML